MATKVNRQDALTEAGLDKDVITGILRKCFKIEDVNSLVQQCIEGGDFWSLVTPEVRDAAYKAVDRRPAEKGSFTFNEAHKSIKESLLARHIGAWLLLMVGVDQKEAEKNTKIGRYAEEGDYRRWACEGTDGDDGAGSCSVQSNPASSPEKAAPTQEQKLAGGLGNATGPLFGDPSKFPTSGLASKPSPKPSSPKMEASEAEPKGDAKVAPKGAVSEPKKVQRKPLPEWIAFVRDCTFKQVSEEGADHPVFHSLEVREAAQKAAYILFGTREDGRSVYRNAIQALIDFRCYARSKAQQQKLDTDMRKRIDANLDKLAEVYGAEPGRLTPNHVIQLTFRLRFFVRSMERVAKCQIVPDTKAFRSLVPLPEKPRVEEIDWNPTTPSADEIDWNPKVPSMSGEAINWTP